MKNPFDDYEECFSKRIRDFVDKLAPGESDAFDLGRGKRSTLSVMLCSNSVKGRFATKTDKQMKNIVWIKKLSNEKKGA